MDRPDTTKSFLAEEPDDTLLGVIENSVVHFKHAHDLTVDLQAFDGDGLLVLLPYTNMTAGQVVYLSWEAGGENTSAELRHDVSEDDVGQALTFDLDRQKLNASIGLSATAYYRMEYDGRERYSDEQTFTIVDGHESAPDYLAPLRIEGMPPGEIEPAPDGARVLIDLYTDIQPADEVILYADGADSARVLWLQVTEQDIESGQLVLLLEGSFLTENLDKPIDLLYAFSRPGRALSARSLTLQVGSRVEVESVVHFKEASGLTLYLKDFRGDGHLTVLPYTAMAEEDQLTLHWQCADGSEPVVLEHRLTREEVDTPFLFTLSRIHLVPGCNAEVYYSVLTDTGERRKSEKQHFSILDARSDPNDRLPDPDIEGVEGDALYPNSEGAKVTIPAYPGIESGDKVVLHADGKMPRPPQWLRVEQEHITANSLPFELSSELLRENAGDFITVGYQYGRKGAASAARAWNLDVLRHDDAVEKSHVHFKQSHDLTVELSAFTGNASLTLSPYRYMAEKDIITLTWEQEGAGLTPLNLQYQVSADDVGSSVTFTLARETLDSASGHTARVSYVVTPANSGDLMVSAVQTFTIVERSSSLPPRLEAPTSAEAVDGKIEPNPDGVQVTINAYDGMKPGDELILHGDGPRPLRPLSLRITAVQMNEAQLAFTLPGEWLIRNAGWPITLFYQFARPRHALTSVPLRLSVREIPGSQRSGKVVHVKQAHDRTVELEAFEGDATLTVLPYTNMDVGQKIEILWHDENEPPPAEPISHTLAPEDLGQTLSFDLPRGMLEAWRDRLMQLYYRVWYGERSIDSEKQDILVVQAGPPTTPRLEAVPAQELHPDPAGVDITLALYEGAQLDDEVVFHADGVGSVRPQWRRINQEEMNDREMVFFFSEKFLAANLDKQISVLYQFGRPGRALSSQPGLLSVSRRPALLRGTVVHCKEAHDLTVDMQSFDGAGHLTVLPYPRMAENDTVTVHWCRDDDTSATSRDEPLVYQVAAKDVGLPITLELPRDYLLAGSSVVMYFTAQAVDEELRTSDPQHLRIVDGTPGDIAQPLPEPRVEGAVGSVLFLEPQGANVTIEAYPDMRLNDEVLFYIDGDKPVPLQWQRIEDAEATSLKFALRRVTKEIVAPNDERFTAERSYRYALCATEMDQAQQWRVDVKGIETHTSFDGVSRVVKEEGQDIDFATSQAEPAFRPLYSAEYDSLGQLISETVIDWIGPGHTEVLTLKSLFEYDQWGQRLSIIGPDGVKSIEQTDPIGTPDHRGPILTRWREAGTGQAKSGKVITWLNLFEQPVRIERKDLKDVQLSLQLQEHDGLGRLAKQSIGVGQGARISEYVYDAFGRAIEHTLADGSVVKRAYARHSTQELPVSISVEDRAGGKRSFMLGTQTFDGLDRLVEAKTGDRLRTYDYAPGQRRPCTITLPTGEAITYQYQPPLSEEPVVRELERTSTHAGENAEYIYDSQNARLTECRINDQQVMTRQYFSTGQLKSETRTQGDVKYEMNYDYSHRGRQLSYTDVREQVQRNYYNSLGQLEKTVLGTLTTLFIYDPLGRLSVFTTVDSAANQTLRTELTYDEFDREIKRTFKLGAVTQTLDQTYDDVDALKTRVLKQGSTTLRNETFGYDLRQRLVDYTSTGSESPVDPYGKKITAQVFTFDCLDNIREVITRFQGGENIASYAYAGDEEGEGDPVQLSSVSNTHRDYPDLLTLTYDANGNLTKDEAGRLLEYDGLNRLLRVSSPAKETLVTYSYDPQDILTGMSQGGGEEHRFYQGNTLASCVQEGESSRFVWGGGQVLAEQQGLGGLK